VPQGELVVWKEGRSWAEWHNAVVSPATQSPGGPEMKCVGLDVHARQFSLAVVDQGNQVMFENTFPTSAENLRRVIDAIAGPKSVVLEESTIAAWAYRVIQPCAQQVIVADPVKNRWIAGDENVEDLSAARKLAQLLRGGFIHPVHHSLEPHQLFKELVQIYHDTARELARFKNKLKAKFHQHGVHCPGDQIYQPARREAWRDQLEAPLARVQADLLWERIDLLGAQQKALKRELIRHSRAFPIIGQFRALPGIGPIRAATFFAVVDTPHRFAHKRKLWAYCGLSVVRRRSDQMVGPEHLTRRGNRALKNVAKAAAVQAIAEGDNAFARQYHAMIQRGINPENARLTVARAIVSAMYAMWRKGEPYQPRG